MAKLDVFEYGRETVLDEVKSIDCSSFVEDVSNGYRSRLSRIIGFFKGNETTEKDDLFAIHREIVIDDVLNELCQSN